MALENMSMILKRLKSVVFIPSTVLARQECVICRKKEKTKKRGSGYETYERCETTNGTKTLVAHDHSEDEYVPVELQDLTIANIFPYHRSYYRNICRKEKPVVNSEEIQEKSA